MKCNNCRYWSQMVANYSEGVLKALCLSDDSSRSKQMTSEFSGCNRWADNHLGQVDDPPDYGESVRAAYAQEDQNEPSQIHRD